jgi:membrane protease subunit (stomatin/prohibitin family)
MAVKRAEMMALWNTDKPDEAKILAKKKELNALRDKLQEKAVAMGLEMKKISPGGAACPMGMGGGMGMGPGGGMGHGCPY